MSVTCQLLLILGLILANGFFAAAEIALITARRSRLEQRAAAGDRRAKLAAELARDPNRFFSTVQVGITLVSTLAAVFGGARVVDWVAEGIAATPVEFLDRHSETIAVGLVVLGITFLSLVLGELVPKRLAIANAERFARLTALPMHGLSRVGRPVVWFLAAPSDCILWLLRQQRTRETSVSVEDIEHMISAGTHEGVLDPAEQMVARRALRLGDRAVREIMRPRIDIDALDVDTPSDEVIGAVAMAGFSRLPIHEGDLDHIVGFVYTKDLLRQQHMGWPIDLRKLLRPALLVPETMRLDKLLEMFRARRTQMAIVLDEFGGTAGLVTMEDVVEELLGEIHDEHREDRHQDIVRRDAKSWLVDAGVNVGHFLAQAGMSHLFSAVPRDYSTMGGLMISELGRIPQIGDRVEWCGLYLEIVDMDGHRVDRIFVSAHEAREDKAEGGKGKAEGGARKGEG